VGLVQVEYGRTVVLTMRPFSNQLGEAATLDSLGRAHHHLGHHRQAIECYRHAPDLYHKVRNRYAEAGTLDHLGDTHHAAGDDDVARETWKQARALFEDLQHPNAEQVRHKLKALS
jgi:tetratricopeptide (TPR) repeat protein